MRFGNTFVLVLLASGVALGTACSSSSNTPAAKTDADYEKEITTGMHDSLLVGIKELHDSAVTLQAAAPALTDRGWDAQKDAAAIEAMKTAWKQARTAYERIEGALAPIFPDIDASIDARYDDFLTDLNGQGDPNLFDGTGVTGLHAIERILYVDVTPARVVTFEKTLPGYSPAAFPATAAEADAFKNQLCAKLIADAQTFEDQWTPQKIDLGGAFQGLISLMNEQREKVIKASTFEEESRYSQRTMADIRDNLSGTAAVYAIFQPWLKTKVNAADGSKDGPTVDTKIEAGFADLTTVYGTVQGDAIPQPPATWSSEKPTAADLASPFGTLYTSIRTAVDPSTPGSLVDEMNDAALALGFPQFVEAP